MYDGNHHPSDIDMFYLGKGKVLIIGEIKNEKGTLQKGQRRILEKIAEGWKHDSLVLYIVHDKYVQRGDTMVNVAECYVREIYYKKIHAWRKPRKPTKVKEIIAYYGGQ